MRDVGGGAPGLIRIGCSGWNYAHWRNGVFYPPRLASRNWLDFYARRFDTVEINTTFYRLPKVKAVRRWVEDMGPMLWQLPPDFRRDDDRLAAALAALPPGGHCFEFRHESWFHPEVYELLRGHSVGSGIGDRPQVHAFQSLELTADWTFVRFHYGTRGLRGNYSETELREWAARILGWSEHGADVYAYFNNDWEGFAVRNGLRLQELLGVEPYAPVAAG